MLRQQKHSRINMSRVRVSMLRLRSRKISRDILKNIRPSAVSPQQIEILQR